jgi:hypothetical protein
MKNNNWATLDLLRSIAVIFMLINHSAVEWLISKDLSTGVSGLLFFIGSFAPVLFFFATGFGYGVAHKIGQPAKTKDVLIKAFLLIIADVFMRGGDFTSLGWDFLAFIGFSMLLLHGFRGRKFAIPSAVILILLLLFIRYGLGAIYNKIILIDEQEYWISVLFGLSSLPGISYWFTPWFCYPLIGFLVGVFSHKYKGLLVSYKGVVSLLLSVIGVFIALFAYILWLKGAVLFRWGTMSLNFFICSLSVISICLAFCWFISYRITKVSIINLLSIKGVSSLSVVPIHYLYLTMLTFVLTNKISSTTYLFAMPFWVYFCFISAKFTNEISIRLVKANYENLVLAFTSIVLVIAITTTIISSSWWTFTLSFMAQYILCLLLGHSYAKR